jgi:hypothetical protein
VKRRWPLKLALCILAGAVVTWAVAWGCALWGPLAPLDEFTKRSGGAWPNGTPREWTSYDQFDSASLTVTEVFTRGEDTRGCVLANEVTFGFPLRSMRVTEWGGPSREAVTTAIATKATWRLNPDGYGLPTRILPLGFALNTLLAAGVVLGVVEGLGAARRWRRRSKGRCPSCNYDRGGLARDAACPECGLMP